MTRDLRHEHEMTFLEKELHCFGADEMACCQDTDVTYPAVIGAFLPSAMGCQVAAYETFSADDDFLLAVDEVAVDDEANFGGKLE